MSSRNSAKRVILEIIRQSAGDAIEGKVRLFKAFYLAHLYYAKKNVNYLTEWPIVHMPKGPGINDFDVLIDELSEAGLVEQGEVPVGPFKAATYRATQHGLSEPPLDKAETAAVAKAVQFIAGKTGAQLSDITHEFSRSWQDTEDGNEMSIYIDLLSDQDYERACLQQEQLTEDITEAWK